jgi:hypothetical protein
MFLYVIDGIAMSISLVALAAFRKPDTVVVSRSTAILAPSEDVYSQLANFRCWQNWSPWENVGDGPKSTAPERSPWEKSAAPIKRTFTDNESGEGAGYSWQGSSVKPGRAEIQETRSPQSIVIAITVGKPVLAIPDKAMLAISPTANGCEVEWRMIAAMTYDQKMLSVVRNIDSMIGKALERGLANLKAVAETGGSGGR